jgi:hypothetical protein
MLASLRGQRGFGCICLTEVEGALAPGVVVAEDPVRSAPRPRSVLTNVGPALGLEHPIRVGPVLNYLRDLRRHIRGAKEDVAARYEMKEWLEVKRRLSETERKHLIDAGQMVRADQFMALVDALVASVRAHVSDPETLRRISRDITVILNRAA